MAQIELDRAAEPGAYSSNVATKEKLDIYRDSVAVGRAGSSALRAAGALTRSTARVPLLVLIE